MIDKYRKKLLNRKSKNDSNNRYSSQRRPKVNRIKSAAFQISRTLSSSQLDRRSSIYAQVDSSRTKSHSLTSYRRKIFFVFMIVSILITLSALLIIDLTATVKVSFNNQAITRPIPKDKYQQIVSDYLNINPIARFRNLNNNADMLSYIENKYPEVQSISDAGKVSLYQTEYIITFRKPVAGWQIGDVKYYVDGSGFSFKTNYYSEPGLQVVDNSGIQLAKGAAIASNSFLSFVGKVVSEASKRGYNVVEASLPLDTTRELDITTSASPTYIKLTTDREVEYQIEDMDNSLRYLNSVNVHPTYLDVRISGKSYYK